MFAWLSSCSAVSPPSFSAVTSALWRFCADIGNLDHSATDKDIEDAFKKFGSITDVWVARKPPGELRH